MYLIPIVLAAACAAARFSLREGFESTIFARWGKFWNPNPHLGWNATTILPVLTMLLLLAATVLAQTRAFRFPDGYPLLLQYALAIAAWAITYMVCILKVFPRNPQK